MQATNISTVFVAMVDQLRRTRVKHTLEQVGCVSLIGDSVNASALLQQCSQRRPDVILLDLGDTDVELLDLANAIRTRSPNTKIIVMDHLCKPSELLQWATMGILAYATSDTDTATLALAVTSVQNDCIWIGAQLTKQLNKVADAPPHLVDASALDAGLLGALSEREREVLRLLVAGHKNFAIAQELAISPETIKSHMRRIMEKLAVRDRTQLVIKVLQQGAA